VSESMRPLVVGLLASELLVNREALPEASRDNGLENFTALQGGIGPELVKEFGERFKDSRSYFGEVPHHAATPREYLQKMATRGKYEKKASCWTAEVRRHRRNGEEKPQTPSVK